MHFYVLGCCAAVEKLAFGPKDAPTIMRLVKPLARHVPKETGSAVLPATERVGVLESIRELAQRAPSRARKELSQAQEYLGSLRKAEPQISLPPQGEAATTIARTMGKGNAGRQARDLARGMTPQQKQVMDAMTAGHELDEVVLSRHLKPGARNPFEEYGHVNPRVILREHARVATLPESQQPVREFQQLMRTSTPAPRSTDSWTGQPRKFQPTTPIPNEAELLERATRGVGGRPGIAYGTAGTRLSRSAQKRVSKRMQEILHDLTQKYTAEESAFYANQRAQRLARRK